jgi:copper transport protein
VDGGLSFLWLPKAAVYGLGQLAIGIGIVRRLEMHARSGSGTDASLEQYLTRFARVLALLFLIALAFRLWAQTASAFGQSDAWAIENLRIIAFESRWGRGWRLQMTAVAVLLAGAVLVMPGRQPRWILFEIGAVGLALAMPLLGHAAGSAWRHGMHVAHNLAAAVWLGTLGVITIATWQSSARRSVERLVRDFSPIALGSAGVVFASGVVAAWVYVGSWSSLWTTVYGRVLLAKLTGVAVVLTCGGINSLEVRGGRAPRRALLTIEWLAALLVLGFAGVLGETEHP